MMTVTLVWGELSQRKKNSLHSVSNFHLFHLLLACGNGDMRWSRGGRGNWQRMGGDTEEQSRCRALAAAGLQEICKAGHLHGTIGNYWRHKAAISCDMQILPSGLLSERFLHFNSMPKIRGRCPDLCGKVRGWGHIPWLLEAGSFGISMEMKAKHCAPRLFFQVFLTGFSAKYAQKPPKRGLWFLSECRFYCCLTPLTTELLF